MNPKEIREAMNEISVLSSLTKHPCIVTYRESFIEKGYLCIVMDFAEGGAPRSADTKPPLDLVCCLPPVVKLMVC